jgi:methylmalonyl-CoA mutase
MGDTEGASARQAWRELASRELKGDPDTLVWQTPEGIPVAPLYTATDLEGLEAIDSLPGFDPYLRGVRATMYANRPGRHLPPNRILTVEKSCIAKANEELRIGGVRI